MTATKHSKSINEILTAMDIHEAGRNLPSKKARRELRAFVIKTGARK